MLSIILGLMVFVCIFYITRLREKNISLERMESKIQTIYGAYQLNSQNVPETKPKTILGDRLTQESIALWLEDSHQPLELDLLDRHGGVLKLAELIRKGEFLPYGQKLIEDAEARLKADTELLKGIGHEPVLVGETEEVRRNTSRGKGDGRKGQAGRSSYNKEVGYDRLLELADFGAGDVVIADDSGTFMLSSGGTIEYLG